MIRSAFNGMINCVIFRLFSQKQVFSFVTCFLLFFEKYFLRFLLITFDLLNKILSLRYQKLIFPLYD